MIFSFFCSFIEISDYFSFLFENKYNGNLFFGQLFLVLSSFFSSKSMI
jgi:hypothetical protein